MGLQLYENGEVDNIDLTESNLTTITSDPNNKHNKFLCEKRPTQVQLPDAPELPAQG